MPAINVSDKAIENVIARLLRFGVLLATTIVILGGIRYLWRNGDLAPDYAAFAGSPSEFRGFSGIMELVLSLRGRAIIQLGLLVLIVTPIARVVFALIGFALEKDRLYTAVSLVVLIILLFGLFGIAT
jgi:uncharacterized membrane protein